MMGKQEMEFHVEKNIQRIQQERKKNRTLFIQNKIEQKTFHEQDTILIRELEDLFIQRNVTNILF